MAKRFISLFRRSLAPHDQLQSGKCHQAVWMERGSLTIGARVISAGEGIYIAHHQRISARTQFTNTPRVPASIGIADYCRLPRP